MPHMQKILMYFSLILLSSSFILFADDAKEIMALDWTDPKWAWMDKRIEADFTGFKDTGIAEHMLDGGILNAHTISFGYALARYQIINGQLYGPTYGPGMSSGNPAQGETERLLRKIIELYPVPDLDIIVFGQDVIFNHWNLHTPVLVTCHSGGLMQIHFPVQLWETWAYFADQVERACETSPWETKIEKYFWRGKPNDADNYFDREMWPRWRRGKLCCLSAQYPELLDAAFTGHNTHSVASNQVEEFYAFFPKKEVSWDVYVQHKYLLDVDGYAASTPGYVWKLLTNCTVFKQQESPFHLWYYDEVKPWIHYVPCKADLSDLFQKLEWAKEHDIQAKWIADNSRRFTKENLMPEHLVLYCFKVLQKYASLQRFTPRPKTLIPTPN